MYYKFELNQFPIINDFYIAPLDEYMLPLVNNSDILILVQSGEVTMHLDEQPYSLRENDLFFIPANHMYCPERADDTKPVMWYIHFSVAGGIKNMSFNRIKSEIMEKYEELNFEVTDRQKSIFQMNTVYLQNYNTGLNKKTVTTLINAFNEYTRSKSIMYNLQLCSIIFSLLIEASQQNIQNIAKDLQLNEQTNSSVKIDNAIHYVSKHYTEKISLDDLCSYCSTSRTQLIRLFKNVLNTTPIKYINNFRLSKAKELLFYYPDKTINEISTELGFDNQHYFAKVFQKKYNESPTQYKMRKHKKTK